MIRIGGPTGVDVKISDLFAYTEVTQRTGGANQFVWDIRCWGYTGTYGNKIIEVADTTEKVKNKASLTQLPPRLERFPLKNIDDMRMDILKAVDSTVAFEINKSTYAPYGLGLGNNGGDI